MVLLYTYAALYIKSVPKAFAANVRVCGDINI